MTFKSQHETRVTESKSWQLIIGFYGICCVFVNHCVTIKLTVYFYPRCLKSTVCYSSWPYCKRAATKTDSLTITVNVKREARKPWAWDVTAGLCYSHDPQASARLSNWRPANRLNLTETLSDRLPQKVMSK